MPDSNTQTPTNPTPTVNPAPAADPSAPAVPTNVPEGPIADAMDRAMGKGNEDLPEVVSQVAGKIAESQNILIALSSDPSVDELSAAIGLSLYLDKLGKRATAIYSGTTPNALEFLKPNETFESSADALQDFVIALNKEKADHLRYKLDGDYVKIYITPYKARIAQEDLEFSYGDFNIDLVLALDVANGIDLDSALREHGRIMHDAVIVNITTGKPGKLGEIEWSDKTSSSISEMVAKLLYGMRNDIAIEKDEATAFLTGIVAATDSFSNAGTTSETMRVSARLMESGADQQLIAKNITAETENEILSYSSAPKKKDNDKTKLDIEHEGEEGVDESVVIDGDVNAMMDDLKAAEASLAGAGAETTPVKEEAPVRIEDENETPAETPAVTTELPPVELPTIEAPATEVPAAETPVVETPAVEAPQAPEAPAAPAVDLPAPEPATEAPAAPAMAMSEPTEHHDLNQEEKVIAPPADFVAEAAEGENKYGEMLEDALAEAGEPAVVAAPIVTPPEGVNPAASLAPAVPSAPEVNGVPEINYMPLPDGESMPMPPTPPIDFGVPAPAPTPAPMPEVPSPVAMGGQPAMQDQVYNQQAANPGAFKIPGM